MIIKSQCLVGPNETRSHCKIFPRCVLYSAPSTEYRYIKYALCDMNLKISDDHKPKPIRNTNPFPTSNPMPLTYDFSYDSQIAPGKNFLR